MNNKGIVGIAVLWILLALSTVAFTALSISRWQAARGRTLIENTRVLALAQAGAVMAWDSDFSFPDKTFPFSTGRVRVERRNRTTADGLKVICEATSGTLTKRIETGWRRVGGAWRADSWRELP